MRILNGIKWMPSVMVIAGLMVIASCKDDEKPMSGISFEFIEEEVSESNGTTASFHPLLLSGATGVDVEVKVVLDKPLSQKALIYYTIGGTAKINKINQLGDYEIKGGNNNYLAIEAGDTEGIITITVFEDSEFEATANIAFETVILTLESVEAGSAKIIPDGQNVYTLKIYEDDLVVYLDWAGRATGDVDMDLFVWMDDPSTAEVDFDVIRQSLQEGIKAENVFIPAGFPSGTYGFSYTYYEGTSDNVALKIDFLNFGGNLNGSPADLTFNATYTLANINKYDSPEGTAPKIVQTMVKNNFNYTGLAQISVPAEGSRVQTYPTVPIDFSKLRINSIFNEKLPFSISGIK